MVDLDKQGQPENAQPSENGVSGSLKADAPAAGRHKTIVIWLRVAALLFAALFFFSQCGMNKPKAKASIVESCIKNVPLAPKWQQDLAVRSLKDANGNLAAQYCLCMWDAPLEKLSTEQIRSFAKITPQEQLNLLGGEAAFVQRDKQCLADLKGK
jgi:hypothetical protein